MLVLLTITHLWSAMVTADAAKPKITMYGAGWCGPCKQVRAFLGANRIPFDYLDVDKPANRGRFLNVCGGNRSIPLVFIGRKSLRGYDLKQLSLTLERHGYAVSSRAAQGGAGGEYGGHSPEWWQSQFSSLRRRLVDVENRIASFDPNTVYARDQDEIVAGLKAQAEIIEESIDQLEIDASRVSLPRQYRAYD